MKNIDTILFAYALPIRQFGFNDLARLSVNVGGAVAGEVDEQFVAGLVGYSHDRLDLFTVPAVQFEIRQFLFVWY